MKSFLIRIATWYLEREGFTIVSLRTPIMVVGGSALVRTQDREHREWSVSFPTIPDVEVGGGSILLDESRQWSFSTQEGA